MEIVYSSATQLASAIRSRRVSVAEVLDAHLTRIEAVNPALNAVILLDADEARQRAREADEALARGEVWGPLHGVPFTVKDAHATAGMRTTSGYPQLAGYVPDEDSTVVSRLKGAGAILMGKTDVPLMLGDYQSNNQQFGRSNNPWDIQRTPGGSSGGAAVTLAAGMTPFEIGTDLAGSIRVPAHFCGVFGLKPTERRVPLTGLIPGLPPPRLIRIMASIGPMARNVEDLALLLSLIAGPDGIDTEVPPAPVEPHECVDVAGLRVAVAPTFPGIPVAAEIRAEVQDLARQLEKSRASVDEPDLPDLDFQRDCASLGELVGMLTGAARPSESPATLRRYLEALERRDQSINAWERFFRSWDVLLCPAAMTTAFPHCEPGSPLAVDDQLVDYWTVSAHTALFNYSGHPAVVLPHGLDHAGLPIGVQLVTQRWHDSRLLAIAAAVSAISGAMQRPPATSLVPFEGHTRKGDRL